MKSQTRLVRASKRLQPERLQARRVSCLLAAAVAPAAAGALHPAIGEVLDFVKSQGLAGAEAEGGLLLCHLGFNEETARLSWSILEEFAPPQFQVPAQVAFLHPAQSSPLEGQLDELRALSQHFPGRVSFPAPIPVPRESSQHEPEPEPLIARPCSLILLSPEDPRFTAELIRRAAFGRRAILAHLAAGCPGEKQHACRFFGSTWDALVQATAARGPDCGRHLCTALVSTGELQDPWLASLDCEAFSGSSRPPSTTSQWQQDWFVYHNFIRGTELDGPGGVFVDIGAFHPIHLSNTFFFERCLGWHGVCVEPNPNWAPHFRAYRANCRLMANCVWSRERKVVMSFQKDPIEAYIQDDAPGPGASIKGSGAVPIKGNGSRPRFEALCHTLQDLLLSAGLQRPAKIHYMSVDAEAAEVEIFRDFPFQDFDIPVISVEVQAQHYYELDAVFLLAGYAKVAVLGGDHVYIKLHPGLAPPQGAAEWHRAIARDFHAHAAPKSSTGKT